MKICDMHTHSINSFDAQNTVDDMCKIAIKKGISALAITDHCETQFVLSGSHKEFGCFDERIPKSISEIEEAKKKYSEKLQLLCGIELAQPMHNSDCTKHALEYGNFDFILASVHNIRNEEDFYYIDFSKYNVNELLKKYFYELVETAEFEYFDSLAHITYPMRYITEQTGKYPDLSSYQDIIDEAYKVLISKNKALEVNTSGYFKQIARTLPDETQIKRYKELGGKFITLGSDSHSANNIGQGIEKGIELIKKCGFEYYNIYINHKPQFIYI